MTNLTKEIDFFIANEESFRKSHNNEWVLISGEETQGFYKDFQIAAKLVAEKYAHVPVLLRQIGTEASNIPQVSFATV